MKLILLISLFLSGCTLPFAVDHLSVPEGKTVRVRRGDTLRIEGQALVHAGKIKNKGTIIVQNGTGNVAAPVEKAKAPVAVGPQASATQEVKKTSGFLQSLKDYATGIVLAVVGVVVLVFYLKFKS